MIVKRNGTYETLRLVLPLNTLVQNTGVAKLRLLKTPRHSQKAYQEKTLTQHKLCMHGRFCFWCIMCFFDRKPKGKPILWLLPNFDGNHMGLVSNQRSHTWWLFSWFPFKAALKKILKNIRGNLSNLPSAPFRTPPAMMCHADKHHVLVRKAVTATNLFDG